VPNITYAEIDQHNPDAIMPVDDEFRGEYESRVAAGRKAAAEMRVAFAAICRNAMPWLPMTLQRLADTGSLFRDCRCYIFENDSTDGTAEFLSRAAAENEWLKVESQTNGRPHLNYTKSADRTIALAEYRNRCREWIGDNCHDFDLAIVFDADPWGGWSVDGVMNTVGHLTDPAYASAAGMASYSWCEWGPPCWYWPEKCHYDGWAFRWTWWEEKPDMRWFHLWHPVVGSPPVRVNSAFGQLAVYRMENYLRGAYKGGDCEHVSHWRSCGGECYLNPSMRVVSFWIPDATKKDDS
jgi:hypothetical protein